MGRGPVSLCLLTPAALIILLTSADLTLPATAATDEEGAELGVCWRLMRADGSCGRLLRAGVTRASCCSGRHRRGWNSGGWNGGEYLKNTTFTDTPTGSENSVIFTETCSPCAPTCAGVRCGEDRKCVERGNRPPRCVCAPQCHLKHKAAVCGSDGRTYASECHLLKRACRKKRRLTVAHYSPCQTCSGVRCGGGKMCVLDEQMTPRCVRCPSVCPLLDKPRVLCGADGVTYSSPCNLKMASCRAAKDIPRAYKGPCREAPTCSTVRCWRGQRCLTHVVTGHPQCTWCGGLDSCRASSRPVCASDGRIYPSWCALRHEACRSGRAITPSLPQHCASNHTSLSDDCTNNQSQRQRTANKLQRRRQRQQRKDRQKNILNQQLLLEEVLQGMAETVGDISSSTSGSSSSSSHTQSKVDADESGTRGNEGETSNYKKKNKSRRRKNCSKTRKRTKKERKMRKERS